MNAETVRIAPQVVGEKRTWQSGARQVTVWVGVDALSSFSDLDLVPVEVAGRRRSKGWTTKVRPDLFVIRTRTGHAAPCDLLYVSTEHVGLVQALGAADGLRVAFTPLGTDAEIQ